MAVTSLVGKVLQSRSVNNEVFVYSIPLIWKFIKGVRVEHIFLFHFANENERNLILLMGPWHFNCSLLALSPLASNGVLTA